MTFNLSNLFNSFYKYTPQLIKFNIPTTDCISFPALGGTGLMHPLIKV